MALDKTSLETKILLAFKKSAQSTDAKSAQEQLAKDLAAAVDTYVRAATIKTTDSSGTITTATIE